MIDIKQRISLIDGIDSFQRIDDSHILDIYLGIDNMSRYTLFLISDSEPQHIFSSQIIYVQIGQRMDKQWGVSFALLDNKFEDMFFHFCSDIIDSSRNLADKSFGATYVCARYVKWQNMLSKFNGGILSIPEVKGIIGELVFLKEYMIPKYGQEIALNSWVGPEKTDQDFICENIWYEVKSTVSGAEKVQISSIEQLDSPTDGELVIVYLDKTSFSDNLKISLNSIYQEVYNLLSNDYLKQKFNDILLGLGFFKRYEYDEYTFKLSAIHRYQVDKDFPCLRKSQIPLAVINIKYDLSISYINKYLRM
jgi:hypothetical protein